MPVAAPSPAVTVGVLPGHLADANRLDVPAADVVCSAVGVQPNLTAVAKRLDVPAADADC